MLAKTVKQIANVITTADLSQEVDATKFNQYRWGRYDLGMYGGRCGYIKDETMEGRVTVFLSGKMISVGAKSAIKAKRQLERAMELMVNAKLVKPVRLKPKIQNMVATLDVGYPLDLNQLATKLPATIYEPEQFPSLIHQTTIGPTLLIFSSGKIVVAGAKKEKEIDQIASTLKEILG